MFKKTIASAVAVGLLSASAVSAAAAPISAESARTASPVAGSEELFGGNEWLIALIFALIAAGIIVLIEDGEGDVADLPASP